MFGGLKNLAQMASLMQSAGGIKEKFTAVKDRISRLELEGTAGGDLVRVTLSGDLRVLGVAIQQGLIDSRDREMIESLTKVAMESAIRKAKEAAAREMAEVAGELNIPGLKDAITRFGIG